MPLGKALWYAATLSEQLGAKIQLVTEAEHHAIEMVEKARREMKHGQ
jgi:hypothetical protein